LESQRPELQQQRETLQASQAELETAREQLAAQQADFESERARWQERRQQQEAALEQQQQEAAQQRAALEEQQAELSREQETLELELQQREADLQTREHSLLETQEHWEQQRAAEEAQLVASRRQLEQQQAALAEQEASWVQSQTGSAGTTATPPADQDRDQAPTAGTQHDAPAAGQSSREERPATWNAERSPASREDVPAKEVAVDATAEGTEQASPSEPFGDRSQAHTRSARERLFGRTQSETPSSLPASPAPDEAEAAFEPPESAAPSDEDDTMQRIRAMVSWMEDDEGEEGSQVESLAADEGVPGAIEDAVSLEDAADASSPHDSHEPSQGAAASGDDHEESIEAYMAQLLSRVQGRSELARPTPADSAKPVTQPVTSPPPAPVAKPSGEEDMQLVNPEPVRRSQPHRLPAELSSNLAAMRELANSTSRTAIDASIRNRWRQAATGKLAVGAIALVCGVILTILADSVFDLTFLGAGVSFVVATFWILQSAIIQRNIIRHSKDDADRTDAAPPDQRQSSHRHHEQSAETGKETAAEEPADS